MPRSWFSRTVVRFSALVFWLHLAALGQTGPVNPASPFSAETSPGFPPWNHAEIVRMDVPSVVKPQELFDVSVILRNSGRNTWSTNHGLMSQNPNDNLVWRSDSRVLLPRKIAPGEQVALTFSCTAPALPGPYLFLWGMVENLDLFGEKLQRAIVVSENPESLARRPPAQFGVRLWQAEDGLPQNAVQALAQTRDGYLWVGTQNGLARFDGVRFTVFHPGNTPELKGDFIYSLLESRDGSLWIGTFDAGLVRWKDGVFSQVTRADGLTDDAVRALCEGRDGALWVGTTNGLSRWQHGQWQTFTMRDGLMSDTVRAITDDRAGNVWCATPVGVSKISQGKFQNLGWKDGLAGPSIRALAVDPHDGLWLGGVGGLTSWREGKASFFTKNEGLADSTVNAIYEDRKGNLWVGTYGGLSRLSAGKWQTQTSGDGVAFDVITAILEDREGNIWVGAKDGLRRLQEKHFTTYTQQHGLTHNNVTAVCEDRSGVLWIATWGGGVNFLKDGKFFPHPAPDNPSFHLALSLHEDRQGRMWTGVDYAGGLYQLQEGKARRHSIGTEPADPAIRVIYSTRDGGLWIGTSQALILSKDGTFTRFTTEDGLAGNTIRVLLEDHAGDLWVGSNEGLSRRKDGKFSRVVLGDGQMRAAVISLHEDAEQDLWIGTAGGGLHKLQVPSSKLPNNSADHESRITNHVSHFTTQDGLLSDDVHEILEDDLGYLWMSCHHGVFRVRKQDFDDLAAGKIPRLRCQVFGTRDGMVSIDCNSVAKPAGWKSRDGRLWFATTKGLTVVDPRLDLAANPEPPPVVIEEVVADKKRIQESGVRRQEAGAEKAQRGKRERENAPFLIPPGKGELEFHYTALSYTAPEKNQFKYRLEGADADWVDAGSRRTAYYNNLRPGSYTFRVQACNNDGVWNSLGANVKLSLQPHYWQAWWFKTLVITGSLSLVGTSVRYATRKRMQRKLERLEQQNAIEKERTRIAQDMHDDLGANLTEILILTKLTCDGKNNPQTVETQANRIARRAEGVIDSLHAIVWAINPRNDSLDKLVNYLCEQTQSFLETSSIRCRLEAPNELPALPISSETRHNVFLVVKESLNNIVKHARANEVRLQLAFAEGALRIVIQDDGQGFDMADASARGNGLLNMEKRMQNIGGSWRLASEAGKGTRIELTMPLHREA